MSGVSPLLPVAPLSRPLFSVLLPLDAFSDESGRLVLMLGSGMFVGSVEGETVLEVVLGAVVGTVVGTVESWG